MLSLLPRVTEATRERVSREFDHFGPEAWVTEVGGSIGMPVQARRIARTDANHDYIIAGNQDGPAEPIAAAKR